MWGGAGASKSRPLSARLRPRSAVTQLRGPSEPAAAAAALESAEETCGWRRTWEGGALPLRAGVRDVPFPFVSHVTHAVSSLLSSHPALRTHNLTVPPSHNATFVFTNDSAYSNFSATVGEHPVLGPRHIWSPGKFRTGLIWFCRTHSAGKKEWVARCK